MSPKPLRLPATPDAVGLALAALASDPALQGLDARARYAVELVTEEVLMNVAMHAHLPADATVAFSVRRDAAAVMLEFVYGGRIFDPRHAVPPAAGGEARVGGMGLVLVRRMARAIDHEVVDGMNRLRVTVDGRH